MIRYLFLIIVLIHGLIHLLGFIKAFDFGEISQLTKTISKPEGILWLVATLLFIGTTLFYLIDNPYWPIMAFIAIALSQVLLFVAWQDAKFGTIANVLILLGAIIGFSSRGFENHFRQEVTISLERTNAIANELLTVEELQDLPEPVQKYLKYVGVVNKPKPNNVKVLFEGEMREKGKDWFPFTSEQYNFFDESERLFFMKAKVKGLATSGYHAYKGNNARMLIKLLSLFPVADLQGEDLFRAETVTVFNDMCLFAPATLIDKRIVWEPLDSNSVKATFTNQGISISAILYFNKKGQLINFVSDDRYAISDGALKQYRFSTPVHDYKNVNGYHLFHTGEAVWHYPEGEFAYGKFKLKWVMYNVEAKF